MAVHSNFSDAFKALYKRIESVKSALSNVLANEGTRFFVGNFDKEGFDDGTVKGWKPRQAYRNVSKKDQTRKILMKSGKLKRAVNNSISEKTFKRIVWIVKDVAYAAAHNFGLNKTENVKAHDRKNKDIKTKVRGNSSFVNGVFKKGKSKTLTLSGGKHNVGSFSRHMIIPKREFMGQSKTLNTLFIKNIIQAYSKSFK